MKISSLLFPVEWNDTTVTCEVSHEALKEPQAVKTKIAVKHLPVLHITASKDNIIEGETVILTCYVQAFPPSIEILWKIDDEAVEQAKGSTELVIDAKRDLNGKMIACFARNLIGQNFAEYTLDIKCKLNFNIV